jgi:hypothetical protein
VIENPRVQADPGTIISTMHAWVIGLDHRMTAGSVAAAAAWPAARRVVYIPLYAPRSFTVTKIVWLNGVPSGNGDFGIYSAVDGLPVTKLLASGSTALTGSNVVQESDVTDTAFGSGEYFLAALVDNATHTHWRCTGSTGTTGLRFLEMCQETLGAGSTLPTTATPIAITSNFVPLFGIVIA